jgi:RNA polymerase sigma-70 factor (ECF subfamily)
LQVTDPYQPLKAEIAALLPRLRRFGRTLTGHREDADDLVQWAVEKALTRLHQWQPGTRVDSWMFRIMQTSWIDELRSRKRRDEQALDDETLEAVSPAEPARQAEQLALRRALSQLNEDQRSVVGLVLVEGLSYAEAAEVLGWPIGTVTSRLSRAREQLQTLLDAPA